MNFFESSKKFNEAFLEIQKVIDGPWSAKNKRLFHSPNCYLEIKNGKIKLIKVLKTINNKRKIKKYTLVDFMHKNTKKLKILQDFVRYQEINQRVDYANYLLSSQDDIKEFINKNVSCFVGFEKHKDLYKNAMEAFHRRPIKNYQYPPPEIEVILNALNEYVFSGFDCYFDEIKDPDIFDYKLNTAPFYERLFIHMTFKELSNHQKLEAYKEIQKLLSKNN